MLTTEQRLAHYRGALDEAANTPADDPRVQSDSLPRDRRRLAFAVAALMLFGGVGATAAVVLRPDAQPALDAPVDPIGVWRQGSAPPFPMASPMIAKATEDGRVVVLGETPHGSGEMLPYQGGIYDPRTDTWQVIPAAPLVNGALFTVAGSYVMAVTLGEAQPAAAAMLDLTTVTWTAIEMPAAVAYGAPLWAWNGDVFAVVRSGPTGVQPGDSGAPPSTWRWDRETQLWSEGTPPSFTARTSPVTAVSAGRIAVWGGTTDDPTAAGASPVIPTEADSSSPSTTLGPGGVAGMHGVFTDGGIYDIATDRWTPIPADEALLAMANRGAAAVLSDTQLTLVSAYDGATARLSATLIGDSWHTIPAPTAAGYMSGSPSDSLLVILTANQSGPQPVQYLDPPTASWLGAPGPALLARPDGLVALSATTDNPGDEPLQAWVLTDGRWQPAVDAPFTNRMDPAVAAVGNLVIVVGGDQGTDLERQSDTWILDLSA